MRRTSRLRPIVVLPFFLSVAGCERGVPIAAKPLETGSRYCKEHHALYRAGGVLFCASPELQFATRMTYSLVGNAATTFAEQVSDVVAVASCLTGRPFDERADGRFNITIDNKITPQRSGGTSSGANSTTYHLGLGAARTGSVSISTENGTPDVVGNRLQDGLWSVVGVAKPEPMALVEEAFAGRDATAASPHPIADGTRYCEKKLALYESDRVFFCAPKAREWPAELHYAVIGDAAPFAPQVAALAAFASRLTGVHYEPAQTQADVLVVLTERELTQPAMEALFRANGITPSNDMADGIAPLGRDFAKDMTSAVVGKTLGPIVADWMSTSWGRTMSGSHPSSIKLIGLHDRDRASTEAEIYEAFFKPLEVEPPAYQPVQSCEPAR